MPEHILPEVPVKHADFLEHVKAHSEKSIPDLVKPYNDFDAVVRKIYAQETDHPAVADNHLNLVPLFDSNGSTDIRIRARDLASESDDTKSKYLMPLKDEYRKPSGTPAVVSTFKEFQTQFNIFSESSLSDLDWNNVIAAGSAAATSILPVPEKYRGSKRGLRQFYHEEFAPASDVDLFLYGLTEGQAVQKIKQIEKCIRDSILTEVSTIRTKHAITIVSQYPTRHVQIVLRRYKSIAEILTGFDVDCSCVAYDGTQVYLAPRAVGAYITQVNQIDLSRRSPSYENRLSKYSHRGFEVFWSDLDRSRIDPSLFERSFTRTVGLARLLVLEKLPKSYDRDKYLEQRREERGRPPSESQFRYRSLRGNIKDNWEDEVAEWVEQDEVSDYHTFTIPYGPKFHARKIEKLLYTKDLLLNAEWNKPKDREVNLHRHPAFFGSVQDVIHDCCGFCPKPSTPEEEEIAAEESKIYISGEITFISDNPGRQEIGSFNPITDTDWTEMAYVGNSAGLCQAIVENDLEEVKRLVNEVTVDVNRRDHTGRTPLHLACMTSTPEIVQHLVDSGARMIWRVADGRTALHLAAARGSVEIVRILLTKSSENEDGEARKEEARKESLEEKDTEASSSDKDSDAELVSEPSDNEDADATSYATGSFVDVKKDGEDQSIVPDDINDLGPDVFDINAIAWDTKASPLHLAILNGHVAVVEELVSSFGADVILPIKLVNTYNNSPRAAILTLVLASQLPKEAAKAMSQKLLEIGASPAQADTNHKTALHYLAHSGSPELLDIYRQVDRPAVDRAINHLAISGTYYDFNVESPLTSAIAAKDVTKTLKLLEIGAHPTISLEEFLKAGEAASSSQNRHISAQERKTRFGENTSQPIILAVEKDLPSVALELLGRGVDPNTLTRTGYRVIRDSYHRNSQPGTSLLDLVQEKLKILREYDGESMTAKAPLPIDADDSRYLEGCDEGTYKKWAAEVMLQQARDRFTEEQKQFDETVEASKTCDGLPEKKAAISALLAEFEKLEAELLSKEAKRFEELQPDIKFQAHHNNYRDYSRKQEPYETKFYFNAQNCTDEMREGYLQLFEAAWSGNIETIKSLTLSTWGPNKDRTPLEVGVADIRNYSPFSIAVLRGHLSIAKAILAISTAQYKDDDQNKRTRYRMAEYQDSDDGSYDSDADSEEIQLESHVIDTDFTIENVGEVKKQVESKIRPQNVLLGTCNIRLFLNKSELPGDEAIGDLIQYAIWKDNLQLLGFILSLGQELLHSSTDQSQDSVYQVSHAQFMMAIRLGRLRCLEELIKRTGAGLPLDKLAEKSGVEIKEKPKYYQGLSVHGKKRADWAAAGGGMAVTRAMDKSPPLLLAAKAGSLASVEWFLGTAPGRYYLEFAKAHKKDPRLRKLALAEKGLERSILDWLNARRDLVLHCAVLAKYNEESRQLVEYLLKHMPHCLEVKSATDYTPLGVAFRSNKTKFAKILIDAGANQAIRCENGMNLLHLVLQYYSRHREHPRPRYKELLTRIDPLLIPSMLVERCSSEPGSVTPLALWMASAWSSYNRSQAAEDQAVDILRTVLDLAESSGQRHLELLDGSGNTPLHNAVNSLHGTPLKLFLERRPDLLHRENAVGSTPAELAEIKWIANVTSNPPASPHDSGRYGYSYFGTNRTPCSAVDRSPNDYVKKLVPTFTAEDIHKICVEKAAEGVSGKRKLVSLFDANEVAKRLALKQRNGGWSYRRRRYNRHGDDDYEDEENDEDQGERDEVMQWIG
ncbi:ankyrin repeat-containing domain protein [Aspergillus pseudoustus]|uniref:Ankyrin repeat-containing domain protein n=1 Tax=Aspergillus pseudoustus TaxID=1810923 RepID=A0ABR4KYP2_9EURO